MTLTVVFANEKGFVTDFGSELELRDGITGHVTGTVPRYGVWKESGRDKMEVTRTTNDLEYAKRALSQSVFEYFRDQLGEEPKDCSLQQLSIEDPCGFDCVRVIDQYAEMIGEVTREQAARVAFEEVEILWRG